MPTKKKPPKRNRDIVSVDITELRDEIDKLLTSDPVGSRTRGAVIRAALRVGLPLLLAKVKGPK